ncbi:HD1 homeodomain mating-type protein Le.a1-6 [Lentinula aciculospora]|uniref:HD1 homeodomain mating-type protein Le.a1-6 n=1 Tax=Lentinula aciculospora TaxID=153920 RepID=A0A9W9ANF9_9AGAR|nr:HD1 homeodomain mating-type protein Le.a1-6 [Lentinula aciculospora]
MTVATDLDNRLVSSLDGIMQGIQAFDLNTFRSDWSGIVKELLSGHKAGTLDYSTSSLAVNISDRMETICDTFMALEIEAESRAAKLRQELDDIGHDDSRTPSRSPSPTHASHCTRSPSPSSSSSSSSTHNLPSYIPPSYEWLLQNLYNPYPPPSIRDSIASSTNTSRRLIDAWFVDVRRRIGWTNLIESKTGSRVGQASGSGLGGNKVRRAHKPLAPGTNNPEFTPLKYKSRKDLITAASKFFLKSLSNNPNPISTTVNDLSALENQTFTILADEARLLYRDKLFPSALAVALTGKVRKWTPELGERVKEVRDEERRLKRKRSGGAKVESDNKEEEDHVEGKRLRYCFYFGQSTIRSVEPTPTTPTEGMFPSSSTSSKRKRAVSFETSTDEVSPSTKRLRTTLNSAGLLRSVSDPTPIAMGSQQQHMQITETQTQIPETQTQTQQPLTFSGFPLPVLDTWFTSNYRNWIDPLSDPVIHSDSNSDGMTPPYPLSINVGEIPFPTSTDTCSISSPSTPALSASGSLSEDDDNREGDSLFGDEDSVHVVVDTKPAPTPGDILNNNPFSDFTHLSSLPNIPDISNLSSLSSFPNLSSLPDFQNFSNFPDFNLDDFPDLSNVDLDVGFDFGESFALDSGFGVGAGELGLSSASASQDWHQYVNNSNSNTNTNTHPNLNTLWAGETPTRDTFAAVAASTKAGFTVTMGVGPEPEVIRELVSQ